MAHDLLLVHFDRLSSGGLAGGRVSGLWLLHIINEDGVCLVEHALLGASTCHIVRKTGLSVLFGSKTSVLVVLCVQATTDARLLSCIPRVGI